MQKTSPISLKLRFRALFFHLLFSGLLLCIALVLVFGIWYPSPLEIAVGVTSIYLLLLAIDLILGPALTFVVYKADKRKLKFDLTVILLLQLGAYFYGLYTLHQGRPLWQVFVIDDIELISLSEVKKTADYRMPAEFAPSILQGPQWVAAVYSSDPKKMQQQKEDEMFDGINISTRPETYQSIAVKQQAIQAKLKPLSELSQLNTDAKLLKQSLDAYPQAAGWLPVKATEQDMVALFNKQGQPLGIVNLKPW